MIDPVEELFEIQVDHDTVSLGNIALRLGDRLVGGASRAEAVAVLGKRRVPTRLKDLQQGLLDQSVDDAKARPGFLTPPSGLGVSTRLTGWGW